MLKAEDREFKERMRLEKLGLIEETQLIAPADSNRKLTYEEYKEMQDKVLKSYDYNAKRIDRMKECGIL